MKAGGTCEATVLLYWHWFHFHGMQRRSKNSSCIMHTPSGWSCVTVLHINLVRIQFF